MVGNADAMEQSRFVEAPTRGELDDLEKQFERAGYATLLRVRRLQRQIDNDELLLKSLTEQATNIRGSLRLSGLDDTRILADKPSYDQAEEIRRVWSSDVDGIREAIIKRDGVLGSLPSKISKDALGPELSDIALRRG